MTALSLYIQIVGSSRFTESILFCKWIPHVEQVVYELRISLRSNYKMCSIFSNCISTENPAWSYFKQALVHDFSEIISHSFILLDGKNKILKAIRNTLKHFVYFSAKINYQWMRASICIQSKIDCTIPVHRFNKKNHIYCLFYTPMFLPLTNNETENNQNNGMRPAGIGSNQIKSFFMWLVLRITFHKYNVV